MQGYTLSGRLHNESTLWLTHRAGHSVSQLALTVAPSWRAPMALIAAISGGHPRPSLWQYLEGTHGPHCGNIRRTPKALTVAISGGHSLALIAATSKRALTSPHSHNIQRALPVQISFCMQQSQKRSYALRYGMQTREKAREGLKWSAKEEAQHFSDKAYWDCQLDKQLLHSGIMQCLSNHPKLTSIVDQLTSSHSSLCSIVSYPDPTLFQAKGSGSGDH